MSRSVSWKRCKPILVAAAESSSLFPSMFMIVRHLRGKQRKHGRQAYARAKPVSGEKDAM
jgi:hypothetical protein